jgi:hypothetical protein
MAPGVRMRAINWVSTKGTTVHLRAAKVQHANAVRFMDPDDDLVAVLPGDSAAVTGKLRYRIWSDETKPREGTIPFRIVVP